ncbi:MAG TPA: M20/M25/M40 family metallo-hydrolase [Terriglobia bacterium]|nr:M20/M25/M40 family metallo-hydrolase [Terriglobia bacterium]
MKTNLFEIICLEVPALFILAVAIFLTTGRDSQAAQDPNEPPVGRPTLKILPPPSGRLARANVDEKSMRATIEELVSCGTRDSISTWDDPKRGVGCGRDKIVARFTSTAKATGGRLQIVVDRFQTKSARTPGVVPMENVYAILPGVDAGLAKTAIVVSGHFDSIPSNPMDTKSDAPGADDDASGVAVSLECARLLAGGSYRATLVFAAVSGEEQGLLGGTRLLEYLRQNGYTVGAMLDNDIVGADFAPGAPHRVRLFSGGGPDGVDSPSRELARAVEEIDGQAAVRLIFRHDRLGRGGDHQPFVDAGLPAVRFTEPLEDYHHEHQTPRVENGLEFGDQIKYLNFEFLGTVALDNAEVLRELALAPAPPASVTISGGVTPDAKVAWTADADPERAGFEVLWRETTDPRWTVFDFTENAGETILKGVSTDNHFFAVRSMGKNGARTIARPAELRRRQ